MSSNSLVSIFWVSGSSFSQEDLCVCTGECNQCSMFLLLFHFVIMAHLGMRRQYICVKGTEGLCLGSTFSVLQHQGSRHCFIVLVFLCYCYCFFFSFIKNGLALQGTLKIIESDVFNDYAHVQSASPLPDMQIRMQMGLEQNKLVGVIFKLFSKIHCGSKSVK